MNPDPALMAQMQLSAMIAIELQRMKDHNKLPNIDGSLHGIAATATLWAIELHEQMRDPKYNLWHIYEIVSDFILQKTKL